MFRRFNLKTLTGVLVLLAAIAIVVKLVQSHKGESSFQTDLLVFDTSKVSSIVVSEGPGASKFVTLEKSGAGWNVKKDNSSYKGNASQINGLLEQLSRIKLEQVAAKSKDKWKDYQVDDSTGLFIRIKQGDKTLKNIVIGKFSWQQPTNPYDRQGTITSYVRAAGEPETYAVNGFLRMGLSTDPNSYRDKDMIMVEKEKLSGFHFTYPDSSFTLEKVNGKWMVNNSLAVDSGQMDQFLSNIIRVSGNEFSPGIPAGQQPIFSVSAITEGNSPLQVNAYKADTSSSLILNSSQNPESFFMAKKDLVDRIFKGSSYFLHPLKKEVVRK